MHSKLAQLQNLLSDAIRDMTAGQLAAHPEGKWSSAEILEHLNFTYVGTIKNLERCLASNRPGASGDRRKNRWRRWLSTRLGFFPSGREAPERTCPRGTPSEQVTSEIMQNITRMDEVITQCESRFPARAPIADHPILGPLTAAEWRGFHSAHGKHHARQILKLKRKR